MPLVSAVCSSRPTFTRCLNEGWSRMMMMMMMSSSRANRVAPAVEFSDLAVPTNAFVRTVLESGKDSRYEQSDQVAADAAVLAVRPDVSERAVPSDKQPDVGLSAQSTREREERSRSCQVGEVQSKRRQTDCPLRHAPKSASLVGIVPSETEHAWCLETYGQPLPQGGKAHRLAHLIGTSLCSAFLVAMCFTASLTLSGLWPVPGHANANFWTGLLNRFVWAISPCFLGGFFPGLCNPTLLADRRCHLFFLKVSLLPFIIANVSFPYVAGTESKILVFFSTCFWPTTTCILFLPSMVAGIRHCRGDENWDELASQVWYIRSQGRFCYGAFPLALNLGLHTSLSAAHCRDWLSVLIWVVCDCTTIAWRTQRARYAGIFRRFFDSTPWLSDEALRERMSFEAIILGWGLTAALASLLVFSPLAWVIPSMLRDFLFSSGWSSVKYVVAVCLCDVTADILSVVYLTHMCNCDFSKVLGHPCSKALRHAYMSSLAVVWAPCALGCFGWVFQHMCIASFEARC